MAKRKLSIWVEEVVADKVEAAAKMEQVSVSQIGARLLERGVIDYANGIAWDVLGDRVGDTVKKEMAKMSDRLAGLVVRSALEASVGRGMLYIMAGRDMGAEAAKEINDTAYTQAVSRLRKPVKEFAEVLKPRAVEEPIITQEG